MKKALVTGGAGFIGSNIARELTRRGVDTTVLDNLQSGFAKNLDPCPAVDFRKADVRDPVAVISAMANGEVVFHLAASVGNKRSIDLPIVDAEINVVGTLRVLEAMRQCGVTKIVTSSSAGIFGELKTIPIREDHQVEPDSPYGCTKLCEEKLCLAYGKLYGMATICLRYFNVYGVNQRFDAYGNVIPIFVFKMLRGETLTIFGDGEQTRDFVNVRDVVQANLKAAESTRAAGAFNIGSGTRVSVNRLVELIAEVSGIKPRVEHGPPRAGDVRDSLADISAARDALGYEPTVTLEEGLGEYIDWARYEVEHA